MRHLGMQKRSSRSKDVNQNAFSIVEQTTTNLREPPKKEKNPAAVALGRLGGLKGGIARAKKLSSSKRREIARNAAKSRWAKK